MRVGIISDTHGLLRPEVLVAMRDVDHILHAGDVGDAALLDRLRQLAPVTAIRGNIDRLGRCALLPATERVKLAGHTVYMIHNLEDLDLSPITSGVAAIVCGHSHRPSISWREGVLYFNPGSAGPRRFSLPISLGYLNIGEAGIEATTVEIA